MKKSASTKQQATPAQQANQKTFYTLLANTLVASVINFTIWFAITFFVYLETQSVFATAMIAGLYLVTTATSGIWFGSLVDHYKKKHVMLGSSLVSLIAYIICFAIYITAPVDAFKDPSSITLWVFVVVLMMGVLVGNIRSIALSTLITILVPEDRRAKANGLVGAGSGVSFLVTSVISGLLVGLAGMYYVLVLAVIVTAALIVHLFKVRVPEHGVAHLEDGQPKKIDLKGTFKVVMAIPGLIALILFTTLNNFLAGVYMPLLDPYGLSLMPVEAWGLLWGLLSTGFIVGGLLIAKFGLGKNPLRTIFIANLIIWGISSVFTIQASIPLLAIGMFLYLTIAPFIEASEQTILQKVVPVERQGRVFGFAQSVEQTASPLTAFLIGPLTQFIFIPFMTDGTGAQLIGGWFGTGADRGIALVFAVTGVIGLLITLLAFGSKYFKQLSRRYMVG